MKPNLLLVYGILKRGKGLDLTREGCKFLGEATLQDANLYHIGGGVGLKLNEEGQIHGEVFEIPDRLWRWLDEIEGNGFVYTRKVVMVDVPHSIAPDDRGQLECWVYEHNSRFRASEKIENGVYQGDY